MCRIVRVGSLDKVARDFAESCGGYGIVMDEELVSSLQAREEEAIEEVLVVITRNPKPIRDKGLW